MPAAGAGTRLIGGSAVAGSQPPKALRLVAGRTLLQRSVDALAPLADVVVVAVPADRVDDERVQALGDAVTVVAGGATRQESVRRALAVVPEGTRWVLVHDAARPFVPDDVVRRVLAALQRGADAVVPAIPAPDSLRRLDGSGASRPLDRTRVRLVQTPQGFSLAALRDGHQVAAGGDATDDATLVELAGYPVTLVEGDPLAFKVTTPTDLRVAEALAAGR